MPSARDKIRVFFKRNVGKIVTTKRLARVAGISEYARRIRELRDEEGYQIMSHIGCTARHFTFLSDLNDGYRRFRGDAGHFSPNEVIEH